MNPDGMKSKGTALKRSKSSKSTKRKMLDEDEPKLPYKQMKPLALRKQEIQWMATTYPNKVPIILERNKKELYLPHLDKVKFLAPKEITLAQFVTIIRARLRLTAYESIFLIVKDTAMPTLTKPIHQIHKDFSESDGYLYMTYSSQEAFG